MDEYNLKLNSEKDELATENLLTGDYGAGEEFSISKLVNTAVLKVINARAVEMKEGYWNCITLPSGETKRVYISDTRKIFIGAVESLNFLLKKEISRSLTMQEAIKEFEQNKRELFKKYSVPKTRVSGTKIFILSDKYIPELDEQIPVKVIQQGRYGDETKTYIEYNSGVYNYNHKQYWDGLIKLYDLLQENLIAMILSPSCNSFSRAKGFGGK